MTPLKSLAARLHLIASEAAMRPVGIEALERDWTFRSSAPDLLTRLARWKARRHRAAPPRSQAIKIAVPRARWIVYFVYLREGGLTAAHRFTLARLCCADAGLLIVCATPDPAAVPAELFENADALYWKDLPGFDFSAYTIALDEIARHSPGSDVLVLNDSVFGPLTSIDTLWTEMRWDLTGLTASGRAQNHIQSYAFMLRDWTPAKLRALRPIFPANHAFDDYRYVVAAQETRFAEVAARTMSVGALWYADARKCLDPTIFAAEALMATGFPFLKRALMTKHSHFFHRNTILDLLRERDHPVPEAD